MKLQDELPGTEAPCIDALDDAIAHALDVAQELADWRERKEQADATIQGLLLEHRDELERDAEGRRCYVCRKLSKPFVAALSEQLKVTVKPYKPPKVRPVDDDGAPF